VGRSSLVTFGSVAVAALMSVVWFATGEGRFEPAVGLLGMLGGLTGILAERRTAATERRGTVLTSLADELRRADAILADPRFDGVAPCVYPRLPVSATDAAVISGALTGDTGLLTRLHRWRDEANDFNRRLELTEMRLFGAGAAHEAVDYARALRGGYLDHVRAQLAGLRTDLVGARK
jgi:hypothetical protein